VVVQWAPLARLRPELIQSVPGEWCCGNGRRMIETTVNLLGFCRQVCQSLSYDD